MTDARPEPDKIDGNPPDGNPSEVRPEPVWARPALPDPWGQPRTGALSSEQDTEPSAPATGQWAPEKKQPAPETKQSESDAKQPGPETKPESRPETEQQPERWEPDAPTREIDPQAGAGDHNVAREGSAEADAQTEPAASGVESEPTPSRGEAESAA